MSRRIQEDREHDRLVLLLVGGGILMWVSSVDRGWRAPAGWGVAAMVLSGLLIATSRSLTAIRRGKRSGDRANVTLGYIAIAIIIGSSVLALVGFLLMASGLP